PGTRARGTAAPGCCWRTWISDTVFGAREFACAKKRRTKWFGASLENCLESLPILSERGPIARVPRILPGGLADGRRDAPHAAITKSNLHRSGMSPLSDVPVAGIHGGSDLERIAPPVIAEARIVADVDEGIAPRDHGRIPAMADILGVHGPRPARVSAPGRR